MYVLRPYEYMAMLRRYRVYLQWNTDADESRSGTAWDDVLGSISGRQRSQFLRHNEPVKLHPAGRCIRSYQARTEHICILTIAAGLFFDLLIAGLNLSGKPVAIYGLGDSVSYGDYFCDAIEEIHRHVQICLLMVSPPAYQNVQEESFPSMHFLCFGLVIAGAARSVASKISGSHQLLQFQLCHMT